MRGAVWAAADAFAPKISNTETRKALMGIEFGGKRLCKKAPPR
jgi:hypothetical protein